MEESGFTMKVVIGMVTVYVFCCTDMWMTSAVPASQSNDDRNFPSHSTLPASASDDTCVAALEEKIVSGIGNWTRFSSSSTNFSEGSTQRPDVTTSVRSDDINRQSGFTWHVPEDAYDRITPPLRTEHQMRQVSADNVRSNSAVGVDSPPLSQSNVHSLQNRTSHPKSGFFSVAVDKTPSHILSGGQSAPKRRSSEHCPVSRHASDAMVTVQMPKQRANSLHALSHNISSVPQNVLSKSQDQTGSGGGDSFPFVAPRRRVQHHQTVAAVLQQSSQLVSEKQLTVEPTSDQHTEKLTESAATKCVTFTDQKVRAG